MNKPSRTIFIKTRSGTVMVEFALILPLLLLLLFGVTELGRALYQQNIFTQAVELGGRYMARVDGAVDTSDCTPESGKWTAAIAVTEDLINCGVDVAGCETLSIDIDSIEVCDESNNCFCVITLGATAEFQSIFGDDPISVSGYSIGTIVLNASTQERYIGR